MVIPRETIINIHLGEPHKLWLDILAKMLDGHKRRCVILRSDDCDHDDQGQDVQLGLGLHLHRTLGHVLLLLGVQRGFPAAVLHLPALLHLGGHVLDCAH